MADQGGTKCAVKGGTADKGGTKWADKGGTRWADHGGTKGGTKWADEGAAEACSSDGQTKRCNDNADGGGDAHCSDWAGKCREPGDWFPEGKPYRRPVFGTWHGGKSTRE